MEHLVRLLTNFPVFFETIGSWVLALMIAAVVILDWFWLSRIRSVLWKWSVRIGFILINLFLCATLFMINIPLRSMISELAKVERSIGKPLPDFSFVSARDGVTHRLSDFRARIIILNYWATYCGPCIEELPTLKAIEESFPGSVKVIAITDEEESKIKAFLTRVEAPTHVGISRESFLQMNGFLPVTIICRDGLISEYIFGRQTFDFFSARARN